jgi:hypothetical protein
VEKHGLRAPVRKINLGQIRLAIDPFRYIEPKIPDCLPHTRRRRFLHCKNRRSARPPKRGVLSEDRATMMRARWRRGVAGGQAEAQNPLVLVNTDTLWKETAGIDALGARVACSLLNRHLPLN